MTEVTKIPISSIVPGDNDRTVFDQEKLEELAGSIKKNGLAQPILVRPVGNVYQIVAGERRFRAVSWLGLAEIDGIIRFMDDEEASTIMLTENVGRADLDPVDECLAYDRRMTQFNWDDKTLAARAGVPVERVRRRLKLRGVREDILFLVRRGTFPVGHAESLSVLDHNRQSMAARPIIEGRPINFRQFRAIVDELLMEQSQENLFNLALFGGDLARETERITTRYVRVPTASHLPPMRLSGQSNTGQALFDYVQDLQKMGLLAEADVVGTVLSWLVKGNYARLPMIIETPTSIPSSQTLVRSTSQPLRSLNLAGSMRLT